MIGFSIGYNIEGLDDATPEEVDVLLVKLQSFLPAIAERYTERLQGESRKKHQAVANLVRFCQTGV